MRAELDKAASKQAPIDAASGASQPLSTTTATSSRTVERAESPRRARATGQPWYRDRSGWILVGSGAALVTTAALLFTSARGLEAGALDEPSERKRLSLRDSADGRRLASYVVGASGLVTLGAGAIKLSIVRDETGATSASVAGRF